MTRYPASLHFKNVAPTLEEKQSVLLVTFFQKKNEFNRDETHTTSTPQPTSNSEIIDRLNSISSDVENLKQLCYDFSKRVMADLELFKNTFIISTRNDGKNTEDTTDAFGLETDIIKGNSGHENVVTAFRTKSEALQKRAEDKNVVTAFRTKSEALQKRAEDKYLTYIQQIRYSLYHKSLLDKAGITLLSIPAEDDDPFSPINTQFLVEVDTAEKINFALREKNQVPQKGGKSSENVEPVSTAIVVFRDTGSQSPCDINLKKKKKRLEESSPKDLSTMDHTIMGYTNWIGEGFLQRCRKEGD
ncbi:integration host factor subunit alpha, partial [Striga asiatica]